MRPLRRTNVNPVEIGQNGDQIGPTDLTEKGFTAMGIPAIHGHHIGHIGLIRDFLSSLGKN